VSRVHQAADVMARDNPRRSRKLALNQYVSSHDVLLPFR
jgi:hypothetical protein